MINLSNEMYSVYPIFFINLFLWDLLSPFFIFQSELIDPAVKGTLNVLRSCAKVHSIKRVIVTSSMAAVMFNKKPLTPDVVIDEMWFSDPVACEELKVCVFPFKCIFNRTII